MEARNLKKAILPRELVQFGMKTHARKLVEELSYTYLHYEPSRWTRNDPKQNSQVQLHGNLQGPGSMSRTRH
jgi:hypothetical protein